MITPSRGRHGSGARKHATSGTAEKRPHTEAHSADAGRPALVGALTTVLSSWVARAKGLTASVPHARVLLLGGGAAALVTAVIVTAIVLLPNRTVRVPDLVGVPRTEAADRVAALGLSLQVRATPFSATVAKDAIAAQEPSAGVLVAPGATIIVDISAGSDLFALPDVIGKDLEAARTELRSRGLIVTFTTAVSNADSGTVIASMPSAGSQVSTGDTVRLTLATAVGAIDASDLTGVALVLDPAPPASGDPADVSLDVATRVSALLTAAGATVTVTRASGVTSPAATPAERTRVAKETSATALVGLSVAPSSLEGMVMLTMPSTIGTSQASALSGPLADALFASLRVDMSSITTLTASGDEVLTGAGLPGVRVRLGSYASASDAKSFADERWLELVANDIYRALAQLYGRQ